jgi:hypothetical protein
MTKNQEISAAYSDLRNRALTSKPEELGIHLDSSENTAYGILMEFSRPTGIVMTLVSFIDGSTSMYFSNGGGMIGCGENENVSSSAKRFVKQSNEILSASEKTSNFSLPKEGMIKVYLLKSDGVYAAEDKEEIIVIGTSKLSGVFFFANEVISQIRISSQKK